MSRKTAFFGIILEPKEQSIHTTNRWWKLPTLSCFRRYVVNSYDINIEKNDGQLPVMVNQVMSILQTKGLINLACTAPCTILGTKSRWPGASKIVNCLENNAGFWNGGRFQLRSCLRKCFNGNWWSTTNAHRWPTTKMTDGWIILMKFTWQQKQLHQCHQNAGHLKITTTLHISAINLSAAFSWTIFTPPCPGWFFHYTNYTFKEAIFQPTKPHWNFHRFLPQGLDLVLKCFTQTSMVTPRLGFCRPCISHN